MASQQQKINYQISPIILTGGLAAQLGEGALPLISLFGIGPVSSTQLPFIPGTLDDAFGAFNVLPGGTLVTQSIGKYPFANQWVAANAVIREPITVSVIMDAPMRPAPGFSNDVWALKHNVFTALKAALDLHNNQGGMYTISTPAFDYTNMIMTNLTDNSRGNNSLPQNAWRFDFERPLVALQELIEIQNAFMSKITGAVPPTTPLPTGVQVGSMGSNPTMAMTIKASAGLAATGMGYGLGGVTPDSRNFPSTATPTAFPYRGIS